MEAAMATTATSAVKKVLVAEVDCEVSRTIEELLGRQGFEVILAREGREALRRALSDKPDAILLDTNLMNAGGLDVCQMLKSNKMTRSIPLAFLTGEKETHGPGGASLAAALLLIPKSFKPQQLISSVSLLVSARRKPAA